jgi:hypothetical protein
MQPRPPQKYALSIWSDNLVTFQFDTPINIDGFGFVGSRVSIEHLQGGRARKRKDLEGRKNVR